MINFSNLINRLRNINFGMNITTIEHNGVRFPEVPEYVVDSYNKFELANEKLSDLAIWQLFCWAVLADKYKEDNVYETNFYKCLRLNLTNDQQDLTFPDDFSDILRRMNTIYEKYKEEKKEYNKIHKEEIKQEKEEIKKKYGTAFINGEPVEVGNTLVENSRIFIGRGDCAYRGGWVMKVQPEDIIINSSKDIECPIPGHHWKSIEVRNIMSIATYNLYVQVGRDKIKIPSPKIVPLSNKSEGKASNDKHKFDKARLIQKNWSRINKAIIAKASSSDIRDKQIGCCAYLTAYFGIRAGNETGKRDNGVVGSSTLLVKNVILLGNDTVHLKFLGKDSMDYDGTQKIDSSVYESLVELEEDKSDNDRIFPNITSSSVNKFLQGICPKTLPDLTLKNFRTYYGTSLLAKEIQKHEDEWSSEMTNTEFRSLYDKCAIVVTKKLNHKKSITKEQEEKINSSSKEKINKAREKYLEIKKKNQEKIDKLEETKLKLKTEKPSRWTNKVKDIVTAQKMLRDKIDEAEQKYKDVKQEQKDKVNNMGDALTTAKSNYSNPLIAYSLCKYCNKEPNVILSKALVERFNSWIDINEIDEEYWINYPDV